MTKHRWKKWHKQTQRCIRAGCTARRRKIGSRWFYSWSPVRFWGDRQQRCIGSCVGQ